MIIDGALEIFQPPGSFLRITPMPTVCHILTITSAWLFSRWADHRGDHPNRYRRWLAIAVLLLPLIGGWFDTDCFGQTASVEIQDVLLDQSRGILRVEQPEVGTSVVQYDEEHGSSIVRLNRNPGANAVQHHSVRIGILANRGKGICLLEWTPTANYLNSQLSPFHFEVVPLDFEEVQNAVEQRSVEFLLVNPSMYVALEYHGLVYRIATFQQPSVKGEGPLPVFGGVIFCRADRKDIRNLRDLIGKRFAAVSPNSMGGWHAAWREFEHIGIHPQRDFSNLVFYGTHDSVVEAVRDGRVDGGTVRSTQLERMALEGVMNLREFRVFDSPSASSDYTFLLSTRLYPEWPFASVKGTDLELGKSVASALLRMGMDDPAALAARGAGWAIPQDYTSLHECLRELRLPPYENYGKVTLRQAVTQYKWLIFGMLTITATILILGLLAWRTSVRLERSFEALRDSELKYRGVVENIQDVFHRVDPEGRTILISPSAARLLDYDSVDDLIGQSSDLYWADPSQRLALLEELARSGQVSDWEFEAVRRDGSVMPAAATVHLIHDDHKRPLGYEGIWRDITDRKRAEAALKENIEKMNSIFRAAPTGIGVVVDRMLTEANERLCEMTGYAREELIGQNARLLYPTDEEYAYVGREKYRQIRDKNTGTVVTRWRRKNGETIEVLLSSTPIAPDDHSVGVTFTALDITEWKRAQEALRESQERFRELAELLPETIFEMDTDGNLTFVNRNAYDHFGYSSEDLERESLNGFEMIAPKDRPRALENAKRLMGGERIGLNEYTALRKDGSTFPAIMHSAAKVCDGRPVGIRGIVIDMTETKKLEAQLRQAHKMEAIGTLAGGIAHDFNNLLHVVQGYADLLLTKTTDKGTASKELHEIIRAAQRGGELTRQLLTFSRKVESQLQPIDLNRTVDDVRMLLERTIPKMIKIELHLTGNLCRVKADASQIEQILMNLALNARDAMLEGGTLTIETKNLFLDADYRGMQLELPAGKYTLLAVTDTGHGMDKTTLEHIFDPFFTTKEVGKGTGLGLSMVYGIVKNHNGHISCSSKEGQGTLFTIYLPAIEQPEEASNIVTEATEPRGGNETILLVDDDDSVRNLGQEILQQYGYMVISAPDGESALRIYREERDRIDLVILDLIMPGMGGSQCLQRLLQINPQIKIVVASGYSVPGQLERSKEVGAKAFINKPYDVRQMLDVLREVLD
jgi:two-component system, cell cycle sensor histidine kinase and response regulator CckA